MLGATAVVAACDDGGGAAADTSAGDATAGDDSAAPDTGGGDDTEDSADSGAPDVDDADATADSVADADADADVPPDTDGDDAGDTAEPLPCDLAPCAHGACANTDAVTGFTCTCDDGWDGDRCDVDVDECAATPAPCDAHASCRNTLGGYFCECDGGWEGDGVHCVDVDECADTPCGGAEACTNSDGGYACDCEAGYRRDADGACVDVDECAEGACTGLGETCINGLGGFDCTHSGCYSTCGFPVSCSGPNVDECPFTTTCTMDPDPDLRYCRCAPGWEEGEGGGCFDVDECARGLLAPIRYQFCVNTAGSAHLECFVGFEPAADGGCDDIDECLDPSFCAADSDCVNREGGANCVCRPGYAREIGHTTCDDIDECAAITSPCDPHATCANTPGAFTCTCEGDLVGDGLRCGLPAESAAECGPLAEFLDDAPSRCACLPGLVGDGHTCRVDLTSTGAEGPFEPTRNITLAPGVHHFTTIHIPGGVVVSTRGSGVLELRATGDVVIEGTISLAGQLGTPALGPSATGSNATGVTGLGARGLDGGVSTVRVGGTLRTFVAVGGRSGGGGGAFGVVAAGASGGGYAGGGGAGLVSTTQSYASLYLVRTNARRGGGADGGEGLANGGAGPGPYAGFAGSTMTTNAGDVWVAGGGGGIGADAAADLQVTTTFRPGSGGGGGANPDPTTSGTQTWSGGGGGGALRVGSPTSITVSGVLTVAGGAARSGNTRSLGGGSGSGGVIYLSAPAIAVTGQLVAAGGGRLEGSPLASGQPGDGGLGRIRLSVDPTSCELTGAFTPPLVDGCAVTEAPGVAGHAYIGPWPD
ncbi:MAG: hypothetical protein H6745_33445 [Deltaproteobacteria bacterium]|nr:hypothetical protein [Deltaproteobacteria bacterium]